MTAIVLVGLPGSGKTKLGRLMAEQMNATFIDLDHEIVEASQQSIAELFAQGEQIFRQWETRVLKATLQNHAPTPESNTTKDVDYARLEDASHDSGHMDIGYEVSGRDDGGHEVSGHENSEHEDDLKRFSAEDDFGRVGTLEDVTHVISTGGGIVEREENRNVLGEAFVVFLDVDLAEAIRRASRSSKRPLLSNDVAGTMTGLAKRRLPWYREVADLSVTVDNRPAAENARRVLQHLQSELEQRER